MNGTAKGILVTGGAGFIGSNFILDWIRAGLGQVVNVDKLTYAGNLENLSEVSDHQSFVMVEEDICDQAAMERLLLEYKPRAIVHFAAETHVDRSILGPKAFLRTNVEGTMSLLEASRAYCGALGVEDQKTFRFLHVSTDEVYGSLGPDDAAFHESTPYSPNSPYAASKAASDHLVRAWFHTYGLPTIITNCSNNYGPFQFPEKLIPLMLTHALAGKPLPIYGDGQQIRDWLYVGDHTSALRTVLENGRVGETYNVGGNNQRSNLEVVTTLCSLLDELVPESRYRPHRKLLTYVADRPGHDRRYAIDARKLKQELGWEPSETFETGLRRTVEWYLAHPGWMEHVLSGSYQNWVAQNYGSRGAAEDAGGKALESKAVASGDSK